MSTLNSIFAKMDDVHRKMEKNQMTQTEYRQVVAVDIKPKISNLRHLIEARKAAVITNSYYVGILNEQIRICDLVVETVEYGSRQIASNDIKFINKQIEKLTNLKRTAEYIQVKYQTLDAK